MFTHRALVTYSNPTDGEIRVKIPALTGLSEITVSKFGRESASSVWQVPNIGEEVIVSSDDENLTNVFIVSPNPFAPPVSTGEPTGFPNRTDSIISFDTATRTFIISPTGNDYYVWCKGNRFDITTSRSVTIPNTSGHYSFYFDSEGTLQYTTGFFDLENVAPVSYVYWNQGTSQAEYFADERHGIVLDWQTHEYLHRTRGTSYASGLSITSSNIGGTNDAGAQIGMSGGTIFDEDLQIDITHSATPTPNTWEQYITGTAKIPVMYRDSSGWVIDDATNFPVKKGTTYPYRNSSTNWTLVELNNNEYFVYWIIASNNLNNPILSVMGQGTYANQNDAEGASWLTMVLTDFPSQEFCPLYRLVFRAGSTIGNTVKSTIVSITDIRKNVANVAVGVQGPQGPQGATGPQGAQGAQGATGPQGGGATALSGLSDVSLSSPASGQSLTYNGTAWANTQVIPAGSIQAYAGTSSPSGWLLCDGSSISRSTYSALFATFSTSFTGATTTNNSTTVSGLSGMSSTTHVGWGIAGNGIPTGATISSVTNATTVVISANATSTQTGTASLVISPYGFTGANNTTTFNVPDLRGRVIAGKDNMGGTSADRLTSPAATINGIDGDFLGRTGGSETHTLTTAQMPSHSHTLTGPTGATFGGTSANLASTSSATSTDPAGSGTAHNNIQPTLILNYIIKT